MNNKKVYMPSISLIFGIFFINLHFLGFSQNQFEHIDSSIVKVVNPKIDLKLWYGSEQFKISDFVVLPKYTILYDEESSKLRLLNNSNRLTVDEVSIESLNNLSFSKKNNRFGQFFKYYLGPIEAWFTIQNDSTVFAGTVTFKGKGKENGFLKINISNNKLLIDKIKFKFFDNISLKSEDYKLRNMSYVTSYVNFEGKELFIMPETFEVSKKLHESQTNGSVFLKSSSDSLMKLYEIPLVNSRILYPIQIFKYNHFIYLFDNVNENLIEYDKNLKESKKISLKKMPNSNLEKRFFGRTFFVDKVTNNLYYKVVYAKENGNSRNIFKVNFMNNSINFEPQRDNYLIGYSEKYVNNKAVFLLNNTNHYIYTFELN